MHIKRQKVPKRWPIKRKGTAYVVRANSFTRGEGIPVLILIRDMLELAKNRKEVKRAIHEKKILLNGKKINDEKNSACLFDVLTIVPSKQNYRINLDEKGKFELEKISEADAVKKTAKIINKKVLKGKKIQINLSDGRNFISNIKCKVNDSVIINFGKGIERCIPMKEKEKVIIFSGKHTGKKAHINKLIPERKMTQLKIDGKDVNVLTKQIMAVE